MLSETSLGEIIGIIAPTIAVLGGVVAYLFKLYIAEIISQRDSYKRISETVIDGGEKFVHKHLELKGIPATVPLAPVVPEHDSPVTAKQQQHADIETLKARAAALDLNRAKLNGDNSASKLSEDAKKLSDDAANLSENVSKLNDADPGDEDPCP